jgi:hypothetical protein
MRWQLLEPHHIDEQVLPVGTIIGDDTQWPFRATKEDRRIGRKVGDALPPSRAMTPADDEARKVFNDTFGGEIPETDPTKSIPLTGAENAPRVPGVGSRPPPFKQEPVNTAPAEAPPTGIAAPPTQTANSPSAPPISPVTPQPAPKPELQKPAGHDSSKNPGDSKDTETAKAPDIKKI